MFARSPLNDLKSSPHIYFGKVAAEDIDVLDHVNHATYFVYFEQARWSFLEPFGLTMDSIRKTQVGPAVLEAHIKYQRELHRGEKFQIHTWAKRHSGRIGHIHQKMLSEDGQIQHAEIDLSFGLIDLKARKLVIMDETWISLFRPPSKEV
jgi:YbgC/YbaW family acyl-CoA thioester hydrolase